MLAWNHLLINQWKISFCLCKVDLPQLAEGKRIEILKGQDMFFRVIY